VEQLMGLDRARRFRPGGVQPWLSGPAAEGLAQFSRFGNINALTEAIESADDAELEAAAAKARTLIDGLSFFARLADTFVNRENATGFAAVAQLADSSEARILTTALMVSLGRSPDHVEGIDTVLKALTEQLSLREEVIAIANTADEDRQKVLRRLPDLPYGQQSAIKRVMTEFREANG
jgi:hypothetical protein